MLRIAGYVAIVSLAMGCGRIGYGVPVVDVADVGEGGSVDSAADTPGDIAVDAPLDVAPDATDAPSDQIAPTDGADSIDVPITGCPIWTLGAFGFSAPDRIAELSTAADETGPQFGSTNLLQITFTSNRTGGSGLDDLYVADRTSTTTPFGAASAITTLNSANRDQRVVVSRDLMRAYYASDRSGGRGGLDVWTATRLGASGMFGTSTLLTGVDTVFDDFDLMVTVDGTRVYFARGLAADGGTGTDIYTATLGFDAVTIGSPMAVTEINTAFSEAGPTLTENQLAIVFSSNRDTLGGTYDLYIATRAVATAAFGTPTRLTGVNSTSSEVTPYVTRDGCDLYFASDRPGGAGGYDLYHSHFMLR